MYRPINLLSHPNLPANLKAISEGKVSKLISYLIGQSRKKLAPQLNILVLSLATFIRWIDKKLQEGAEIHNRALSESDRRYANNFYHMRGNHY